MVTTLTSEAAAVGAGGGGLFDGIEDGGADGAGGLRLDDGDGGIGGDDFGGMRMGMAGVMALRLASWQMCFQCWLVEV
jgi:hypothetical protein